GWLPTDNDLSARFGGDYDNLSFNGAVYGEISRLLPEPLAVVNRRMQAIHVRGCVKVYEAGDTLAVAHSELKAREKNLTDQIRQAQRSAESALGSVTTIGRLIDV